MIFNHSKTLQSQSIQTRPQSISNWECGFENTRDRNSKKFLLPVKEQVKIKQKANVCKRTELSYCNTPAAGRPRDLFLLAFFPLEFPGPTNGILLLPFRLDGRELFRTWTRLWVRGVVALAQWRKYRCFILLPPPQKKIYLNYKIWCMCSVYVSKFIIICLSIWKRIKMTTILF